MRFGVLAAVAAVILGGVILSAGPSSAQSGDLRGPREGPPPGFRGAQYVDSGGCVFVRAGVSGRTTWVPRIGRDRRQLCGLPPSFTPAPVAVAEAPRTAPEPAAAAPRAAAPAAPPPAAQTRRAAAESPAARPAPVPDAPAARVTPGCPGHSPHGERLLLTDGRFSLICFRNAAAVPVWAVRRGEARPDCDPAADGQAVLRRDGSRTALCAPAPRMARSAPAPTDIAAAAPSVPRGYKPAWTDGRLNPMRAKGTAEGQARQDRIWTRDTPMRLVETERRARNADPVVTMSASGAAAGLFVQVGSFAQPANADRARARLAALGLPVAQAQARGQQVVLAGPFVDAAAARQAQARLRQAGFGDAFIR